MKVKIKRIDKSIPLPTYQTKGAVGFDIYTRTETVIQPNEIKRIPGNIIIQVPPGFALFIVSRSSTPARFGLLMPHGFGVLDQDFCGPEDELSLQFYNFSQKPVRIKKGTRIAQAVLVRIEKAELEEVERISSKTRGGFGSTG